VKRRQQLAADNGIVPPLQGNRESLVSTHDAVEIYDVFKFRRFRLNVIGFLKLPLSVSESALREVIKESSTHLFVNYMSRAERAGAGYLARTETRSVGGAPDVTPAAAVAQASGSGIRIAC
jgi:hypothetical protein